MQENRGNDKNTNFRRQIWILLRAPSHLYSRVFRLNKIFIFTNNFQYSFKVKHLNNKYICDQLFNQRTKHFRRSHLRNCTGVRFKWRHKILIKLSRERSTILVRVLGSNNVGLSRGGVVIYAGPLWKWTLSKMRIR